MRNDRRSRARILAGALVVAGCSLLAASGPAGTMLQGGGADAVSRFLTGDGPPLTRYRALRRLEAATRGGKMTGSVVAWTELDPEKGFRYEIVHEEGSGQIRTRVLHRALDAEEEAVRTGTGRQAALIHENYVFGEPTATDEGLLRVGLTPRRSAPMLIEGAMLLNALDGDLVRLEGRLVKRPSFWTRRVDIVRRWGRLAGVRVPLSMESRARVLIVGTSSFSMTWDYESVNGFAVGSPGADLASDVRGVSGGR
jgi:hypothetical protein